MLSSQHQGSESEDDSEQCTGVFRHDEKQHGKKAHGLKAPEVRLSPSFVANSARKEMTSPRSFRKAYLSG